jgi:hypothetical protein
LLSPKIIVLCPVKNEAWILHRFLAVSSRFADHIVIADQGSDDGSLEIYKQYPKITLLRNPDAKYDEASRQNLLLGAARELAPGPRLLLALDADEILAADATAALGWRTMCEARPGTVLYFEKPDLFGSPFTAIRRDTPWPLGYVDDGAPHAPRKVHSIRVPTPPHAQHLVVNDVKVLHYSMVRPQAQAAKMRMYAVLENVLGTTRLNNRRLTYAADRDWTTGFKVEAAPASWYQGWVAEGVDMFSIEDATFYWQDVEVLRHFAKHGCQRFWMDDIWSFDWEGCLRWARDAGMDGLPDAVRRPPAALALGMRWATRAYRRARRTFLE